VANSNVKREQMAGGFTSGILLALVPPGNLLFVVIFTLIYLTKASRGARVRRRRVLGKARLQNVGCSTSSLTGGMPA